MRRRLQYGLDDGASVYSSNTTATSQHASSQVPSRGPFSVTDTASLSGAGTPYAEHQLQQYAGHHQHHHHSHAADNGLQHHQHHHPHELDHASFAAQASAAQELDDDLDGVLEDLKLDGGLVEHACRSVLEGSGERQSGPLAHVWRPWAYQAQLQDARGVAS